MLLLRSGWRTDNIGDIAQTPGMLRLIEQHFSDIHVILWSNATERGVAEMLLRHYPQVRIISGEASAGAVNRAFQEADFLLHGSGASIEARDHMEAWHAATGKPYGVLGVTISDLDEGLRRLLAGAAFVYTRETASLDKLKKASIRGPVTGFAPDAAFSLKLSNDEAAKPFMEKNGLEPKKFIAVVPGKRAAANAMLRETISAWVRQTGNKALLCPEMNDLLYDQLPAEVKPKVARRKEDWIPDEASSVYRRAVAVLSTESHSPIIAATNDTPGIYIRQPEDGNIGQMWTDVGLGEWAPSGPITETLMKIHANYDASQVDVHEAVIYARSRQSEAMEQLRKVIVR